MCMFRVLGMLVCTALLAVGVVWLATRMTGESPAAAPVPPAAVTRAKRHYRAQVRLYQRRARWTRHANEICGRALRRERTLLLAEPGALTFELFAKVGPSLLVVESERLAALRRLRPPSEDRHRVRALLTVVDRLFRLDRVAVDALQRKDLAAFRRIVDREHGLEKRAARLIGPFWLPTCGTGPLGEVD